MSAPQGLGEPHKGRGLHIGAAGERGSGSEREFIRMLERVGCGLPETLREMRLNLDQATLKAVEGLRRFDICPVAHPSPLRRATIPLA